MKATWIVAAVAVAALGCGIALSASSAPRTGPPAIGQVRVVESGADVVLPFDAYRHTAAEINVIERATALLARDCLVRFGHDWSCRWSAPARVRRMWTVSRCPRAVVWAKRAASWRTACPPR